VKESVQLIIESIDQSINQSLIWKAITTS
jgi:hypothetical protein